ncbi:endopeptidase La [Phycisphaerales bacterium AB-hyl4]|uniref:Lon protease n=1 Tax=Natronomicrosphaera hydrolytica TaxID=3242702 RepID=A0ABV4U7K1_9BACT
MAKRTTKRTTQRSTKRPTRRSTGRGPARQAGEANVNPPAEAELVVPATRTGDNPDENEAQAKLPEVMPLLPLRGTVAFPGTVMPLTVGRPSSRQMLEESLPQSKIIAFVAQKDEDVDEPEMDDLYRVATAGTVLKLIRQQDDTVSIIVHGLRRVRIKRLKQEKPYLRAAVEPLTEKSATSRRFEASVNQLRDQARQLIELTPNAPEQALTAMMNIEEPGTLADFLASNLDLDVPAKQDLLEETNVEVRVRTVLRAVTNQLEMARLQQKIQQDVQSSIGQSQRKLYLREQLKAIQRELGEDGEAGESVQQLRDRLEEANLPEEVMNEAQRELNRLDVIPAASPEYSVITTYLELLADLPWNKASEDKLDLERARRILDRDHYNLEKVKRRLIEYLAVRKLNPEGRGPILCLVGPPGVGKTSLGQSIADALGRKFARMSLGGIRDEAEVRGHRRTYIGAMPGRIIQELRRAGTNNPVMMLDEVDKLGADFRGDPSSALLEVLDPRQNNAFVDRYLDVAFDLSQVIFIATANYMGTVPPALRDRMEVIDIAGYTDHDKVEIARKYLVPRQLTENGLTRKQCQWRASGLRKAIDDYTREAGVRELERQIGAVCRGVAARVAGDPKSNGRKNGKKSSRHTSIVDGQLVREMLGPEKYTRELEMRREAPGVAMGLAYTPAGGEVLFVEATAYPGKGNIVLTGQIGDVMKESASAALSLFKSRAPELGYDVKQLADRDLHIHVPAGAVPKDGPSAGVAMYTAIASLLLDLPIRSKLAMTGEVTLRGKVLPVGGIKEKSLAASRVGIKTIVLPKENQRDMEEVDTQVKKKCRFEFVENVDDVLAFALGKTKLKHVTK